jgi:hypothetical protein
MTTEEIYNQIIAEKESGNYPELDTLNSTSRVSIWRLWAWIFAFFSKTIRELFDSFQSFIQNYFATQQAGTLRWWLAEVKKFQWSESGEALEYINGKFQYATVDTEKQIVQQVALERVGQIVQFKVARLVDDELAELTEPQRIALQTYINQIKFPGTYTAVISVPADTIRLNYRIYYNGQFDTALLQGSIETAINNYLKSIVFNGRLSITEITDVLQSVTGIINPVFVSSSAKTTYQIDYETFADYYTALAGYMVLDSITIDFIAQNV